MRLLLGHEQIATGVQDSRGEPRIAESARQGEGLAQATVRPPPDRR